MSLQQARETTKQIVKQLFKNDYGEPFELTDTQADIFNVIWLRKHRRNQLLTYTQYGKTDTVSMALLLRSQTYCEPWTILAGKKSKGMLIMQKLIQHTFDNELLVKRLERDADMPIEELKRSRSKEHVSWLGGGGVRVLSAKTSNRNVIKEALIGEGSQNLIEEEAPHIPDDVHAMVMRMLIGHKDNFLLKIGNAFNRNHYFKTWHSDKYHKVYADYHVGLKEGRITQEQIDEVKDLPFFAELYECKFPQEDDVLVGGYRKLIPDDLLENAFITMDQFRNEYCTHEIKDDDGNMLKKIPEGYPKMGVDFAGSGSDRSSYVIRWPKVMMVLQTNKLPDTMLQIPIVEDYIEEYDIEDSDVAIDYGGLGTGAGDRLHEKDVYVNRIMFGQSAPEGEKDHYKNVRAYMYHELLKWLKGGGKIVKDDGFYELLVVNYKEDSERRFQIQPKEDLKKLMQQLNLTGTSPDVADAAALTFADNTDLIDEDDIDFI